MRTWSNQETDALIKNYGKVTNTQLHGIIPNKTPLAIYKKAKKLGLQTSDDIVFQNRSEARKGAKSSNWKGGVCTTSKGYRQLLIPDHPRADKRGYVLEHIVVWERETGSPVPEGCCIHHLNGNKSDNRIQNLCLMQHKAHTVLHHEGKPLSDETKAKISEKAKGRSKCH